ncbi:MAG: hypothetical protein ACE10C_15615 [Candidatus Binatia bacterium]
MVKAPVGVQENRGPRLNVRIIQVGAYGPWPNALFVIHRDGRLVYRCNMMNSPELRQFLEDLSNADRLVAEGIMVHTEYSERVVGHEAEQKVHHRVYERAGPKAFEDYWKVRPHLRNRWP